MTVMFDTDRRQCVRCGRWRKVNRRQARRIHPLCFDCRLVTTALGEQQKWSTQ